MQMVAFLGAGALLPLLLVPPFGIAGTGTPLASAVAAPASPHLVSGTVTAASVIIAAGSEVICAFGRFEDIGAGFERRHQAEDGSLGDLARIGLQLRKSLLDRVHVWAVERLISQFGPHGFCELFDPRSFAGRQIVDDDDIALR
jgi:hypothetical protein